MGSIGASSSTPTVSKTRTEKMVDRIAQEVNEWYDDMYDDDKEAITDWHSMLEYLNMDAREARETIIESLESDIWDSIYGRRNDVDRSLSFDDDGQFEDENGNFLKYGEVMKLVKQELVKRGILKVAR